MMSFVTDPSLTLRVVMKPQKMRRSTAMRFKACLQKASARDQAYKKTALREIAHGIYAAPAPSKRGKVGQPAIIDDVFRYGSLADASGCDETKEMRRSMAMC
jgi:hypothetical protein